MEEQRQKSWFSRNWGWVLGGGCLSLILIVGLIIGGVIYKVSDSIAGSEPYVYALDRANDNQKVTELLGEPIESNGIGSSKFNFNNGTKFTRLSIPIKGSLNEGTLVVEGVKVNDNWVYNTLYVNVNGETINLKQTLLDE